MRIYIYIYPGGPPPSFLVNLWPLVALSGCFAESGYVLGGTVLGPFLDVENSSEPLGGHFGQLGGCLGYFPL